MICRSLDISIIQLVFILVCIKKIFIVNQMKWHLLNQIYTFELRIDNENNIQKPLPINLIWPFKHFHISMKNWLLIISGHTLKIHLKLSIILKTRNKVVWSNALCIKYVIHWNKTQMLKTVSFEDKIKGTKNAFVFLSLAPTHHIFTFNLNFIYEVKHKVYIWGVPFLIPFGFY